MMVSLALLPGVFVGWCWAKASGLGREGQYGGGADLLPSPLVGEGGHKRPTAAVFVERRCLASATRSPCRMRGYALSTDRNPSPVFASRSHPLPQGERGR